MSGWRGSPSSFSLKDREPFLPPPSFEIERADQRVRANALSLEGGGGGSLSLFLERERERERETRRVTTGRLVRGREAREPTRCLSRIEMRWELSRETHRRPPPKHTSRRTRVAGLVSRRPRTERDSREQATNVPAARLVETHGRRSLVVGGLCCIGLGFAS